MVLFFYSCKKDGASDKITEDTNLSRVTYNTTQYLKYQAWLYLNKDDLGKLAKDVKDKILLEFANKVIVLKDAKVNEKVYFNVSLPDKSNYWIAKEHLTEKFVTINQPDVVCYKQPDSAYVNSNIKLQPGDFAYFVKEQDGFINVDFISYMPRTKNKQSTWVGNVWIKDGFTDDFKIARESYLLARVYNDLYGKTPNKDGAIQKLREAQDINGGEETEITYVLKTLLNELVGVNIERLGDVNENL